MTAFDNGKCRVLQQISAGEDVFGRYMLFKVSGERFPLSLAQDSLDGSHIPWLESKGIRVNDQTPYSDYTRASPARIGHMIDGRRKFFFDRHECAVVERLAEVS